MKVLVTGAKGFFGRNMCQLLSRKGHTVFEIDLDYTDESLVDYIQSADFICHFAGVNRPLDSKDFYSGNYEFTKKLVDLVKASNKNIPILMTSSIQAALDNDYGKSKRMAEDYLLNSGLPVYVFRLTNTFGKWARPNYNSVVATFCYNIAHDLPIEIRDRDYVVKFNYIDDACNEFLRLIEGDYEGSKELLSLSPIYECTLGKLADLIYYFKNEIESDRHLPLLHSEFELKLFKTYCNYATNPMFSLNFAEDNRGSFEELFKSNKWGQISENIAHHGITKGGHYHNNKEEIFYTVVGKSEIVQKNIENGDVITNIVDGKEPLLVPIKKRYTHKITNIGDEDSSTLMWVNEIFDANNQDTYKFD
ncbi:MAG: NAD-dependent epimerase/dehydratase family protein [Bacilli bacterium]|nr:NAD-dependent epimerase/dehydratase family protein [Bacilli bacterium]